MFEHAIFSVISPEGCASILWRDTNKASEAAKSLKLTAQDMKKFKVVDEIIIEPLGGAHRDYKKSLNDLGDRIDLELNKLLQLDQIQIIENKHNKYLMLN